MNQDISQERVMHKLLERQAAKYGERTFIYFENKEFSFQGVNDAANRAACGLQKLGIGKGDKVAVVMDSCPDTVSLVFGLSKLGAIVVPINTAHKGEIMTYMLDQSDSRMLVMHNQYMDRLRSVLPSLTKIQSVVMLEKTGSAQNGSQTEGLSQQMIEWSGLIDNDGKYQSADVLWSDPIMILYTSGTTGLSKGVVIPQNLLFSVPERFGNSELNVGENDCIHNCLPLFHAHAWHAGINLALIRGARVVLIEKFSASKFWDENKQFGCRYAVTIGGMLAILVAADPRPDDEENPVKFCLGGPASPIYCENFEKRFGVRIFEFYGSTELSTLSFNLGNRKIGSCGWVHPDYSVKIVNDYGEEVGVNTPGEVLARPNKPYIMMLEYYKIPAKTAEAWQDLWFHTGDNGFLDQDGFLIFADRKKDAIRRRGENISSIELEKVINSHSAVRESAVFGMKSELGEDDVMACVVIVPGQSITSEELTAFCEERMAYFMIPRYLRFMEDLPKTAVLRVEKFKLREQGVTPDTWDRERVGYKIKR